MHDNLARMTQAEHVLKKLKDQGVTQERLGEAMGVRQNVISGWKRRGFIPAPQQSRVLQAAANLQVTLAPSDFFEAAA
jgi:hypothetical protein